MPEALQTRRLAGHRRHFTRPPLDDPDDSDLGRKLAYPHQDIQTVRAG